MNSQKHFFKNAFKNLIKNKIQLIAIIILVFLTAFIFTLVQTSSGRIKNSYKEFISEQQSNLHDFVIDLNQTTYINDFQADDFKTIANLEVRNNLLIKYLQNKLNNSDYSFEFDRIEARNFTLKTNKTLKVFALNPEQKINKVIVADGMSLELWKQYESARENYTKRWVYLNQEFALANKIKINDVIRLSDDEYGSTIKVKDSETKNVDVQLFDNMDINYIIEKTQYANQNWFQVVGFATSGDFSAPVMDNTKPLPNTKDEGLVYTSAKNFGLGYEYLDAIASNDDSVKKIQSQMQATSNEKIWYTNGDLASEEVLKVTSHHDKEIYYAGKFNNNKQQNVLLLNDLLTNLESAKSINLFAGFVNTVNTEQKLVMALNDLDYRFAQRTTLLTTVIKGYEWFSYLTITIVLLIAIVMLVVMLTNQIKKSFGQMGVLAALGYKDWSLIWVNSLYPFFITIIGGIAGFLVGFASQNLVINLMSGYFSIILQPFTFSWSALLVTIIGIFLLLEIITLTVYFIVFSNFSPLEMINFENKSSTNKTNLTLKKVFTRRKKFNARFQGAMLANSLTKLISVFNVMLVASGLMTLGFLLTNILEENKNKIFAGNDFNNLIEYETPVYNSPVSFYKTYNPNSVKQNIYDLTSSELINSYLDNQITANHFQPGNDLSGLNNLAYKAFDLNYLKDASLTIGNQTGTNNNYYKAVMLNLWNDLSAFGWDTYLEKAQFINVMLDNKLALQKIADLEKLRLFYLKYSQTIGIEKEFWRADYIKSNITVWNGIGTNPYLTAQDNSLFNRAVVLTNLGSISGNTDFSESLYNFIGPDMNEINFREKRIQILMPIYNWFISLFHNNLQQAFLQGIFATTPQVIRENIVQQFYDSNGDFTIGFNLVPFDKQSEELGVYINAISNQQDFKIYGLESHNKNQKLFNNKGENLLSPLFETTTGIVINQSLAKILQVSAGQQINVQHIIKSLSFQNNEVDIMSWDANNLDATDDDGFTNSKNIYSSSLLDNQTNNSDWNNLALGNKGLYQSQVDPTAINQTAPNLISQLLNDGSLSITNAKNNQTYTIVGIHEQYGEPKAWIKNDIAKKLTGFDQTQKKLFEVFKKEWQNPKNVSTSNLEFVEKMNLLNFSYEDFINWSQGDSKNKQYLELFEKQYPVFNYKTSALEKITDIESGVYSTQVYGDFSMYGLNGGVYANNKIYSGHSKIVLSSMINAEIALGVIGRINLTINSIIYFVLLVAILLSALIILLIINLVIAQNAKVIAAMKILGYKESYLAKLFIGTYIPIVIIGSIIGFALGYGLIILLTNSLIGFIVLPFTFYFWFIIPGIIGSWIMYAASVSLSWASLKRISPLLAVQGG